MQSVLSFLFISTLSTSALAQIADSSFFPTVRSLNPGVAHQRGQALVALDASKKKVEKNHDVQTGGIVGGIKTDVDLQKNTFFGASRGKGFFTFEVLADNETGERVEHIVSTSLGTRDVTTKATSNYAGVIADFKLLGVSYAFADYKTDYKFRVGEPPNVSARDTETALKYSLLKVGTSFNIKGFTLGVFGMDKRSSGDYTYTYYDPNTGNKGTTEVWPAKRTATGYGAGLGYTSKQFRVELSLEQMGEDSLDAEDNPMDIIKASPASSRMSGAVEARFGKLALGLRVRNIVGNFTDLEDLISANLLYGEMTESDSRLETSFNFSWGSEKGATYSAFYTQSESETEEETTVFDNGILYPAKTKSSAYGINISYYF